MYRHCRNRHRIILLTGIDRGTRTDNSPVFFLQGERNYSARASDRFSEILAPSHYLFCAIDSLTRLPSLLCTYILILYRASFSFIGPLRRFDTSGLRASDCKFCQSHLASQTPLCHVNRDRVAIFDLYSRNIAFYSNEILFVEFEFFSP